ncbi:hypothetical protein PR1_11 [Providencia phage vB_PreS_PR1]|uniref:Uncharacterized protein n=1 Tax=Providencia phage vB_PreS_PR1 TaxID=1931407 RepID=A0A1S6KVB8_9CAUD|nr:hypothetical protein FDH30_gp011 [Providencia phage vB_PreS_PR1]AQT25364.1 hypothetical protein PR1_11 [Providencia phage vB_PreS_PR1]
MQHSSGWHLWVNDFIMYLKVILYMLAILCPVFGASSGLMWLMTILAG